MNKKEIIIVHTTINIYRGVGTVIRNLVKEQQKEYYKVLLAVPYNMIEDAKKLFPDIEIIENYEEKRWLKYVIRGTNLRKLKKHVEEQYKDKKVQIITHAIGTFGIISKVPQKSILVLHGRITDGNQWLKKIIYKQILNHAKRNKTAIVSVSEKTREFYLNNFGIDSYAINNCVDVKSLKQHNEQFTIGFAGCIDEHKGYKFLIDAARILTDKGIKNFKVKIAGENWEGDTINNLINQYNLSDNVEYMGDIVNYSETQLPYIDLMVLPSLMEGLPMSLLEAQALGIPILATNVGGIPELLVDDYNGYFIKRDGQDIAEKIMSCMDKKTYDRLCKNSLYNFKKKYTVDKMTGKYDEIINDTI